MVLRADSSPQKEDLPILCERFTTSKLQKFEDLTSIATYGFRGEALASISHIAHLTVTTKTKDSDCAWRAHFDEGKLAPAKPGQSPEPKPVAGRPGTQIMVEDLFYNVPTRRRAFRSPSDEYNKIIDMVGRYAVHCSHVAFSCKKQGDASTSVAIQSGASVVDRIRQLYGGSVASEIIEYETSDDRWGFKARGWATNANYSIKKTTLLLFINHRSVESTNIRKALEQTYAAFLPKNGHPFVYLSLEIDPQRVDVNVHPTKREVNFLNEDEIIQAVCENIRSKLAAVDTSRTFVTQTLLPGGSWSSPAAPQKQQKDANSTPAAAKSAGASKKTPARPYENNLVRTDTNARKITSMFSLSGGSPAQPAGMSSAQDDPAAADRAGTTDDYEVVDREAHAYHLGSVRDLQAAVRDDEHHELTKVFANHTFVGVVDERRRLAAIQSGVKLSLVDYGRACFEYLYQIGLTDFGNFGVIRFSPPPDLRQLLTIAAEHEKARIEFSKTNESDKDTGKGKGKGKGKEKEKDNDDELGSDSSFSVADVVEHVAAQLIERREMLLEYFSLDISPAGELLGIPLLIKGYTPAIVKLPQFLLRLGPNVDWTEEKACFESFLQELATFYVPEQLPPSGPGADGTVVEVDEETESRRKHVRRAIEHVFFPAFKARLVATKSLRAGGILEVADLKGLYRVFERC